MLSTTIPIPKPSIVRSDVGYAIPIITLFLVLLGFIYYIYLIQRGKLTLTETFVWILFTLLMVFIALYLLILQIMSTFGFYGVNLFEHIATFFGLVDKHKKIPSWLVFIIMIFLAFLYSKSFHTTIKISKLKLNISDLSREVAIINGKLDDTLKERKIEREIHRKQKKNDK